MRRRAVKILYGLFAFVGLIDLLGRGLLIPLTGTFFGVAMTAPHALNIVTSIKAPSGSEKAVLYYSSLIGPGCTENLSVMPTSVPAGAAWLDRYMVFTTVCGDQLPFSWEPAADGRAKPRLRVDAEAASGNLMRRFALGGSVAVAYRGDP